ncbi:hypothetical protein ACO0K2_01715 [Undibacterium sp. MH2W]|uniref:hypothetical protein n=1 Tax=Undibacterium sp. MH2W TaxID=3413044 RepID=UPI003BF1D623
MNAESQPLKTADMTKPEPIGSALFESWFPPLTRRKSHRRTDSGDDALGNTKKQFKAQKVGYVPLSSLLDRTSSEMRLRPSVSPLSYTVDPDPKKLRLENLVSKLFRDDLVNKFVTAFSSKFRVAALVYADELIRRGIPPAMWFSPHADRSTYDINQKSDLTVYDLRWLRFTYPVHSAKISYKRLFRNTLTHKESAFYSTAEFLIYGGNREPWEIVASLKLSESQQYEMCQLQSLPLSRRNEVTNEMRRKVFTAIKVHSDRTRKTKTFTDDDAKDTVFRRHRFWLCSRTVTSYGVELTRRYEQMTGICISVDIAKRQLKIVDEILAEAHIVKRKKGRKHKAKTTKT